MTDELNEEFHRVYSMPLNLALHEYDDMRAFSVKPTESNTTTFCLYANSFLQAHYFPSPEMFFKKTQTKMRQLQGEFHGLAQGT